MTVDEPVIEGKTTVHLMGGPWDGHKVQVDKTSFRLNHHHGPGARITGHYDIELICGRWGAEDHSVRIGIWRAIT